MLLHDLLPRHWGGRRHIGTGDILFPVLSSFVWRRYVSSLVIMLLMAILGYGGHVFDWLAFFCLFSIAYLVPAFCLSLLRSLRGDTLALYAALGVALTMSFAGAWLGESIFFLLQDELIVWFSDYIPKASAWLFAAGILCWQILNNHREAIARRQQGNEQNRSRLEKALLEAELKALQAQIEPHFLYNTLANVQYLTKKNPELAERMVSHLIGYLRTALPDFRGPVSTLGRELQLVENYLAIMSIRMGERLHFSLECADALRLLPFPPLVLITLVENAIKHGIEPKLAGGHIVVSVSRDEERIMVQVVDDGMGLHGDSSGNGVGIANLMARLQGLYNGRAQFELMARQPCGVCATVQIPAVV